MFEEEGGEGKGRERLKLAVYKTRGTKSSPAFKMEANKEIFVCFCFVLYRMSLYKNKLSLYATPSVVYVKLGVFYIKSLLFCIKSFVVYINSFELVVICCVSLTVG